MSKTLLSRHGTLPLAHEMPHTDRKLVASISRSRRRFLFTSGTAGCGRDGQPTAPSSHSHKRRARRFGAMKVSGPIKGPSIMEVRDIRSVMPCTSRSENRIADFWSDKRFPYAAAGACLDGGCPHPHAPQCRCAPLPKFREMAIEAAATSLGAVTLWGCPRRISTCSSATATTHLARRGPPSFRQADTIRRCSTAGRI